MREIKFRGLNNGKWVYGYLVKRQYSEDCFICFQNSARTITELQIDPNTVGQYTGLHDKNGVEIYEGDVIKVADSWDDYGMMAGEIREIYYHEATFKLKPKYGRGSGHYLEDGLEIDIIGNIHDDKENEK